MTETNAEGLTWEEWRNAAGVKRATFYLLSCWREGEDPSETRAFRAKHEREVRKHRESAVGRMQTDMIRRMLGEQ